MLIQLKILFVLSLIIFQSGCGTNVRPDTPTRAKIAQKGYAKILFLNKFNLGRNLRHEIFMFDQNEDRHNIQVPADQDIGEGVVVEVPHGVYAVSGVLFFYQGQRILFDEGLKIYRPFRTKPGHINVVVGADYDISGDGMILSWTPLSAKSQSQILRTAQKKYQMNLPVNIIPSP